MNSIRRHLLLALFGGLCAALLLAGWATYRTALDEAGTPLVEIIREAIRTEGDAGGFSLASGAIEATIGTTPGRDHILLWVARE